VAFDLPVVSLLFQNLKQKQHALATDVAASKTQQLRELCSGKKIEVSPIEPSH